MKILIKNIRGLVQVETDDNSLKSRVPGREMDQLPMLEDAWLAIEDDTIVDFGTMDSLHGITDWSNLEVIDAENRFVFPSWCDSHTHLVFAASREGEFVDRIHGLTYEQIAARGGGILNSARKMQDASEANLLEGARKRLKEISRLGTGAVEIKSGYGLTVEAELKMLRVIKQLREESAVTIRSTFLGAHAIPQEYKTNRQGYIDLIIQEMLPAIEAEKLADYIDVFCESNYFSVEEMTTIVEAGIKHGLKPKIHVNQFNAIGGIAKAVELGAVSVDHLEVMKPEDIEALAGSNTIPTLLPSCSFFLQLPYGPAKELMEQNLPVALATDYNPGSTPSGNIPFLLSLACIKMRMTPEQAINAVTLNGASAMDLSASHGSIARGKRANLFITREMPSYAYLPYAFGSDHIETVILNGQIQD